MFRAEITAIIVDDLRLYGDTGEVGRWANRLTFDVVKASKIEAPSGAETGRVNKTSGYPVGFLRDSIHGDTSRIGPRQISMTIQTDAPYGAYVHEGVDKMIFAKSVRVPAGEPGGGQFKVGAGLYIPANPGWGKARWEQRVRGQRANPFFTRGMNRASRTHPSIRGKSFL